MKKIFGTTILAFIIAAPVYGQDTISSQKRYLTNSIKDNWYVSLSAGGVVYFGNEDNMGPFGNRISAIGEISFGKWVSPKVAVRASLGAGRLKGYSTTPNKFTHQTPRKDGLYKERWEFGYIRADVLFNMSAVIAGYNEKRFYECIPYIGLGYSSTFRKRMLKDVYSVNLGLINKFRISDAVSVKLELAASNIPKNFDAEIGGTQIEGYISLMAGVIYYFNKRGFTRGVPLTK